MYGTVGFIAELFEDAKLGLMIFAKIWLVQIYLITWYVAMFFIMTISKHENTDNTLLLSTLVPLVHDCHVWLLLGLSSTGIPLLVFLLCLLIDPILHALLLESL